MAAVNEAQEEAGEVAGAQQRDGDAGGGGGGERKRQRGKRPAPARDDGGDRPGDEPEKAPDGEEEEHEGEAGLGGHAIRGYRCEVLGGAAAGSAG